MTDAEPRAVLFDFSGTLFHIDDAARALLAALGPEFVRFAPAIVETGGLNGSSTPSGLPAGLAEVWVRRDLDRAAHRAAYTGSAQAAGLAAEQARRLYDWSISPRAWHPYPDTIETLRRLHERGTPTAVVSNIGWDPRPVLRRYGVARDVTELVLSDERGVTKPDPALFTTACDELGVGPADAVMIGDTVGTDGAAERIGIRFVLVDADPDTRPDDALLRATGLDA